MVLDIILFKGSVHWKLRWVYNSSIRWILASNCGAISIIWLLIRHCLVLNIIPFPVSTAKLTGEFYNNRRSVVHRCSSFTYSFASLILSQYYWCCDSYSANRRSTANMKILQKYYNWRCKSAPLHLKAWRVRPASPISAGSHAAPILLAVYSI
jgi:hypothetical protein